MDLLRVARAALLAGLTSAAVAVPLPAQGLEVALTFDDLPANCTVDDFEVHASLTRDLLRALAAAGIEATAFVNEVKLEEAGLVADRRVALLEAWLEGGHTLGNHSYSHPSLFTTPLEAFEQDVLDGERVLRPLLQARGTTPRYFRHPFLNTGPTIEVRDAFVEFLDAHGYAVAPVTIDNHEWIYARAYDRALDAADGELAERLGEAYIDYMDEVVAYYEAQSEAFLGRQIKQVLLLHANRLNAARLPELIAGLRKRGYRFVTLESALEDSAYDLPDAYAGRGGITWLHRWALTAGKRGEFFAGEPPAPAWVSAAAGLSE